MAATLFLVRHGRTAFNAEDRLRGHLDVPLDGVGDAEAASLAELFTEVPLAIVVTSPLRRARVTGQAVADACRACCTIDLRLIDRDYGTFAGEMCSIIETRFGTVDAAPGVEPMTAVRARAVSALEEFAHAADRPWMIVAHDAINRVVLSALVPEIEQDHDVLQPTGCWNELRLDGGRWGARVVGATPGDGHLPTL